MNALQKAKEDYEKLAEELKTFRDKMRTWLNALSGSVYSEEDNYEPFLSNIQEDFYKLSRLRKDEQQARLKFRELEKVYNDGVKDGIARSKSV